MDYQMRSETSDIISNEGCITIVDCRAKGQSSGNYNCIQTVQFTTFKTTLSICCHYFKDWTWRQLQ